MEEERQHAEGRQEGDQAGGQEAHAENLGEDGRYPNEEGRIRVRDVVERGSNINPLTVNDPVDDLDLAPFEPLELEGVPDAPQSNEEVDGDGRYRRDDDDNPTGVPQRGCGAAALSQPDGVGRRAQELAGRRRHCRAPMAPSAQTTQMIPSTQARLSA